MVFLIQNSLFSWTYQSLRKRIQRLSHELSMIFNLFSNIAKWLTDLLTSTKFYKIDLILICIECQNKVRFSSKLRDFHFMLGSKNFSVLLSYSKQLAEILNIPYILLNVSLDYLIFYSKFIRFILFG